MDSMKLSELVGADDVILGVRAPDIAAAAAEMLRTALPHHGFSAEETERLIGAVVAREREMPTTCGGSAIPHARDAAVRSFIVAIGTNGEGILEGQSQPRVILAFLSPTSKTAEHLELLRTLSSLAHDAGTMKAIAESATAADVMALLPR
jgi:mannitol/fructose-specific phosphotransferase system IIA component (Ntr-type)